MTREGTSSDIPGGDLTEHGADAEQRHDADPAHLGERPADEPGGDLTEHGADPRARHDTATGSEPGGQDGPATQTPGGDLTEHGADPSERDAP